MAMLENILEEEDDAFVFFYEDNDTDAHTILEELEQVGIIFCYWGGGLNGRQTDDDDFNKMLNRPSPASFSFIFVFSNKN